MTVWIIKSCLQKSLLLDLFDFWDPAKGLLFPLFSVHYLNSSRLTPNFPTYAPPFVSCFEFPGDETGLGLGGCHGDASQLPSSHRPLSFSQQQPLWARQGREDSFPEWQWQWQSLDSTLHFLTQPGAILPFGAGSASFPRKHLLLGDTAVYSASHRFILTQFPL